MIASRRFLPSTTLPLPPGLDLSTASAGAWPKGVPRERWEPHWQSFAHRYAEHFGAHPTRLVVYLWLTSNEIRAIHELMERRYPGYLSPEREDLRYDLDDIDEDVPDVSTDPDFQRIALLDVPRCEALLASDFEDVALLGHLKHWPAIVKPDQLAAIRFDVPEHNGDGW